MTTIRLSRGGPIALLALLSAIALIVAACGGSDDESSSGGDDADTAASLCPVDALEDADGPVEIALWHGVVGLTAQTLDEFAGEYNASQDEVTVRVESQGDYEEQQKKFTDALRDPSSLPNILLAEDTNTQFMVDSRSAVPADACIEADPDAGEVYDQLMPAVAAGYSVEGVQWPAGFGVSTPVIYYNRKHFTEAGLDPESPPTNLDEIRAAAEALLAARPGIPPFVFRADAWWLEHLSTRAGDEIVNENNGRDGLADTSELLNDSTDEWTTWMQQMVGDGLAKVVAYSQTFDAYLAVAQQNGSMLIETSTAANTVDGLINGSLNAADLGLEGDADLSGLAFPDLDISVGELPGFTDGGSGQIGGNAWYVIGAGQSPEEIAASWDFIKWANETDQQVKWTMQGSYLPVFSSAAESDELNTYFDTTLPGGWLRTAFESLQEVDPDFPGPVIGPYKEFRSAVRAATENALIGGQPIDETFAKADDQFQAALDEYQLDVGAG